MSGFRQLSIISPLSPSGWPDVLYKWGELRWRKMNKMIKPTNNCRNIGNRDRDNFKIWNLKFVHFLHRNFIHLLFPWLSPITHQSTYIYSDYTMWETRKALLMVLHNLEVKHFRFYWLKYNRTINIELKRDTVNRAVIHSDLLNPILGGGVILPRPPKNRHNF